jgi:predicted RNA-binding protein with PIN domain
MISLSYLFEGKVIEHLKRNKGKYALGAGIVATGVLAEPEISTAYHKAAAKKLWNEIDSDKTDINQKLRKSIDMLHHGKKAMDANDRNLLNKKDYIWTNPKTDTEDHIKNVPKYKKYDL